MRFKASIAAFVFVVCGALFAGATYGAAPVQPSGPVSPAGGLVSLDFQDADIHNVLKVLSYKSGVNIVSGPEVTGAVTIQLTDVPWQKALEVILATHGYGYERNDNIITVATIDNIEKRRKAQEEAKEAEQAKEKAEEDAKQAKQKAMAEEKVKEAAVKQALSDQEPLSTKTYSLNYAKAADVVESMNKIKTAKGTINFDQRTNVLIIRDVKSNMNLLDGVVKTLDSVTPQVMIEAKVIETTLSSTENLGVDWSTAVSASGAARPTTFPFVVDRTNHFLPSHALIDPGTTSPYTYGTLSATALSATLDMLSKRTDTHILSNPKIVTLDNNAAKIVVGSQYPIPTYTYNSDQGKMQLSGWNYMDIGVIFEVTPHVNNATLVTLDLNPTITAITDYVIVDPAATAKVPVLSTEGAKTKVMIRDGQTLVIAGLISETTTRTRKKIPFLGSIPFLGQALFGNKDDQKNRKEILIFLTPHIITANRSPASATGPAAGGK